MRKFYTSVFFLLFLISSIYSQTIDTENPVWTSLLPINTGADCDNIPSYPTLTASDNSGIVNIVFNEQYINGSCPSFYTLIRNWTATDLSGNYIVHVQTINVQDNINPYFIEPLPIDFTVDCSLIPLVNTLTAADNCSSAIVNFNEEYSNVIDSCNYTILRTWVASDYCGNTTSYTQTITVINQISIVISGVYNDFNSDGFVNVGDVINYQYSLTNNETNPFTNISLLSPNATISGGILASLASGATNSSTFTGTHVITQGEINTHTVNSTVTSIGTLNGNNASSSNTNSFNLPISDGIRLNAFLDTNNNGIQDSGETTSVFYGSFVYTINGGSSNYIYFNPSNVAYLYESNPSTLYNLSFSVGNYFYSTPYYTCSTTYSNIAVTTGSGITTYNFPIQYNPFTDLGITLYSNSGSPSPGFIYSNLIHIRNNGTQTIPSGTVTFTKDANVTITAVNQTVTNTPTGFTYNFTNLLPFESRYIVVTMQVPTIPTVALGQVLTNSVATTIPAGDVLVSNNTSSLTQTIVGSYDPNDKQEIHGGRIVHSTFTSNDFLTYTIRFENTGTANAINVKVDDVLDSKLNENSIVMVASSHNYVLNRNGANLSWRFNGIDLPPSNGSVTIGHGYITFQIKPKSGYAIGDIIPNYANIYFDFNPAIVTNVCTTEFVATLSNQNFTFADLNYFPNPVKNSLSISNSNTIDFIEITSVLGQKILAQKVNDLQTEIDMSNLSKGIYFVKIVSQNQEKVVKIVKE